MSTLGNGSVRWLAINFTITFLGSRRYPVFVFVRSPFVGI